MLLPTSLIPDVPLPVRVRRAEPVERPAVVMVTDVGSSPRSPLPVSSPVVCTPSSAEETEEIVIKQEVNVFDADALERTETLKELKKMCHERGLGIHGKKRDLAVRIVQHSTDDKLCSDDQQHE